METIVIRPRESLRGRMRHRKLWLAPSSREFKMPPITRRTFVTWLSTAVPLTLVARRAHALSVDSLTGELAPTRTLVALGGAFFR